MLTEMEADLKRTSTSEVTAMRNKIAAAIRFYQPYRFYFNESRSVTFTTTADTDTYTFSTIGTEFYRIDGAYVLNSTRYQLMRQVDYRDLEPLIETSSPSTGIPNDWSYIAQAVRLYPVPNDAYTIRLDGHIKIAAPATDGEANNKWMTEAYDLIMCRAKAELYAHVWLNPQLAAVFNEAENLALSSLMKASDARVGTGEIEPTQF